MDVSSFYTNIPHSEAPTACRAALERSGCNQEKENMSFKFILNQNNFTCNDRNYARVNGTAMGTRMISLYLNSFMAAGLNVLYPVRLTGDNVSNSKAIYISKDLSSPQKNYTL